MTITSAWDNIEPAKPIIATKPIISICIPYNLAWEPEWVEKVYIKLKYQTLDWCTKITFLTKVPSISVARDNLVTASLNANADYIFFIDSDIVFESPTDPNDALKILYQIINKDQTKDGKIISGLYRAKQSVGLNYAAWMKLNNEKGKYIPIQQWTGNYIEVDVTGLGCTLIDTKIFKEAARPFFHWENNQDISEDFYFLEKAKEYGYNLHIMTDVRLSHLGNLKVKSDGSVVVPDM